MLTLNKFLCYFWISLELDMIVGLIFHQNGFKTNIVTHVKFVHVKISFTRQRFCRLNITENSQKFQATLKNCFISK